MARRLAGPSVLRLLTAEDDPDADSITLVYDAPVGGTLAHWSPQSAGHLATVFAAAFEAVAELHRAGVAHGSLSAESIHLDAADRPLLARLADARPGTPVANEADVSAVVELLTQACDRLQSANPSWAQRLSGSARTERRIHRLIAEYHHTPRAQRPSAQQLAGDLAAMVRAAPLSPENEVDADDDPRVDSSASLAPTRLFRTRPPRPEPHTSTNLSRTIMAAAGAVVVGAAAAIAVVWLVGGSASHGGPSSAAVTTTSREPVASGAADELNVAPPEPTPSAPACAGLVVADRCELVELGDGFVVVGDQHFAVGTGNEHLAFGDWDCDGTATVAAVRPSTGEVFVFDEWRFDGPVEARLVARLHDVATPRTITLDNGCHDLEIPNGNELWTLTGART